MSALWGLFSLFVLLFPVLVIVPFLVTGYSFVIKTQSKWQMILYVLLVIFLYLLLFQLMNVSWGHSFPGPGYMVYTLLPYTGLITFGILALNGKNNWQVLSKVKWGRSQYTVGVIFLFVFQLFAQEWFRLINPFLISEFQMCQYTWRLGLTCW